MDETTAKLARAAAERDWQALGLLLDRLEETGDKRHGKLDRRLGRLSVALQKARNFTHPSPASFTWEQRWQVEREAQQRAWEAEIRDFLDWLARAFWAELEDKGRQGLLERLERGFGQ